MTWIITAGIQEQTSSSKAGDRSHRKTALLTGFFQRMNGIRLGDDETAGWIRR